jgi:UDP-N-acetylglucosamine--N-acetylmuramyl-(pentapeptide) pyrophosphoryl-undecaprenol N-acetylglucosamine transferase
MPGNTSYKIIISGGGTGGHIFPAIAIANEIRNRFSDAEILFVGANGRMEMEKVPLAGYAIKGLNIAGFQRGSIFKNLSLPFKIADAIWSAKKIIQEFEPHAAVGVGGYASGPLLLAAGFCGIPCVIQEQNSYAGITNKILARWARRICVAYDGMEKFFPAKKIVKTGNPVRENITGRSMSAQEGRKHFGLDPVRPTLLVIGGSLGARTLNESTAAAIGKIDETHTQLIWQTGKYYFDDYKQIAETRPHIKVLPFIDRMEAAYSAADIIISRAGALAISELQVVGKPAILVPSPHVAEDHQTHNALALVQQNAAILIKDHEAKFNLIPAAIDLLQNETVKAQISANIQKMAIADATKKIVDEIFSVIHKNS